MRDLLRDVLDDVAAGEVTGLRIDLTAAAEQGRNRRTRLRLVSSKVMLLAAAAAVVGLVLPVLLVVSSVRPAHKENQRLTASGDWAWLPADEVPPVTDVRMDRARMLLAMTAADAAPSDGLNWGTAHATGRAPVVLSADGKAYAALPWDRTAGLYTLSKDGRRAAWVTVTVTAKRATVVVHQLTLAEGRVRSTTLPAETRDERPTALFFESTTGGRLVIHTRSVLGVPPKQAHLWAWDPAAAQPGPTELCSCLTTAFGLDADGAPWQATNRLGYYPDYRRSPAEEGVPVPAGDRWGSVVATPRLVISTGGEVTAGIGLRYSSAQHGRPGTLPLLVLGAAGQRTVQVRRPGTGPAATGPAQAGDEIGSPLDWTLAGIVVSYAKGPFDATSQTSLLLIDPGTGRSRTLGVGDGRSIPMSVSDALPTDSAS